MWLFQTLFGKAYASIGGAKKIESLTLKHDPTHHLPIQFRAMLIRELLLLVIVIRQVEPTDLR